MWITKTDTFMVSEKELKDLLGIPQKHLIIDVKWNVFAGSGTLMIQHHDAFEGIEVNLTAP